MLIVNADWYCASVILFLFVLLKHFRLKSLCLCVLCLLSKSRSEKHTSLQPIYLTTFINTQCFAAGQGRDLSLSAVEGGRQSPLELSFVCHYGSMKPLAGS